MVGRYPGFIQSMLQSPCPEIRFLCRVAAADINSTTRGNINYITTLTGRSPLQYSAGLIKSALPVQVVPPEQQWRLGLLTALLTLRREKHIAVEETERLEAMLASLCST